MCRAVRVAGSRAKIEEIRKTQTNQEKTRLNPKPLRVWDTADHPPHDVERRTYLRLQSVDSLNLNFRHQIGALTPTSKVEVSGGKSGQDRRRVTCFRWKSMR